MSLKRTDIDLNAPLSERQQKMLEELEQRPVVYDEDLPKLSKKELAEFRSVAEIRREERRKQNLTLRLSPGTIKKAKSLGKGYTGILARIVENALNDPDAIRRAL